MAKPKKLPCYNCKRKYFARVPSVDRPGIAAYHCKCGAKWNFNLQDKEWRRVA